MRDDPFALIEAHRETIKDRFEGWELIEFLNLTTEDVLDAIKEFGWVDYDNVADLLEFVGIKE
jgi:hypothetical protein